MRKIAFCIIILICCCCCNINSDLDDQNKVSNDFYYRYIENNNEITISLIEKSNYIKSSFEELYDLYDKYKKVEIVTFEKGDDKFYPNTLKNAFYNIYLYKINGFENIDTSYVVDFSNCFRRCNCINLNTDILSNLKTNSGRYFAQMFQESNSLIVFKSSRYDFSNAIDLNNMFHYCENLGKVDFSITNFENVKTMIGTFDGCNNLKNVDFSNSNFSNCENVVDLFFGCNSLNNVFFDNVTMDSIKYMGGMFDSCINIETIDLSCLNLYNLKDCIYSKTFGFYAEEGYSSLFGVCTNLKKIYLPKSFDLKHFDYKDIFYGCDSLEGIYYKDGDNIELIKSFKK